MATFNPNGRKKQPEPYPGLFTPPPGREIVGGFVNKYGAGTVTRSAGASNPAIGATPYAPPSPAPVGTAPYVEPPDDGSNIIEADFQPEDTANVGMQDAPDDWQAAHDARAAEVQGHRDRIAGIHAHVDAVINGQPPPAAAIVSVWPGAT